MASLLDFLSGLSDWAYLVVFLASIAETVPGLGLLVPGQLVVIAAGASASLGFVDVPEAALAASAGAIVGDWLGYEWGRRGGHAFLLRHGRRFGLREAHLDASRGALERNAFLAIVGGRLNSLARAFVPFAAGAGRFPRGRFLAYNAVGGLAWGFGSVVLGFAFGRGYKTAEAVVGRVAGVGLLVVLAVYLAYRAVRALDERISGLDAAWFLVAVAGVAVFGVAAEDVVEGEGIVAWDAPVAKAVEMHATPAVVAAMARVSDAGSAVVVVPVVLVSAGLLARRGRRVEAARVLTLFLVTQAVVWAFKHAIARTRPATSAGLATGFSFPSGHTTTAAVLACVLAWMLARRVHGRLAAAGVLAVAVAWVGVMGVSRLALGVHYASDVIGGAGLGFAIAGFGLSAPAVLPRLRDRAVEAAARSRSFLVRRRIP